MKQLVKKYRAHLAYHNASMILVIIAVLSVIIVPLVMTMLALDFSLPLLLLYLALMLAVFINLGVSASVCKRSERQLMHKIWDQSESESEARTEMKKCGVRYRSAEEYIFSKQRSAERNAIRLREEEEAMKVYSESQRLLADVAVPQRCNIIPIEDEDDIFCLGKFSEWRRWKVWRDEDRLYFYVDKIWGFPRYDMSSPYLTKIELSDILYFKVEGSVRNEVKVSGGTVKQDKYGKVTQTALKTQNISKDNRKTVIKLNIDSVICEIVSNYDAYDVLFSLIPEKEFERVRKG